MDEPLVEPRRQAARADPGRDLQAAAAPRCHHHVRHPRPGRGDDHGRSGGCAAAWGADAVRSARPSCTRAPDNLFVATVHRLTVDERRAAARSPPAAERRHHARDRRADDHPRPARLPIGWPVCGAYDGRDIAVGIRPEALGGDGTASHRCRRRPRRDAGLRAAGPLARSMRPSVRAIDTGVEIGPTSRVVDRGVARPAASGEDGRSVAAHASTPCGCTPSISRPATRSVESDRTPAVLGGSRSGLNRHPPSLRSR